ADCTGAAVVIGTLKAIADLQLKVNVVGLAPLTENMPSGKATKPTDVFFGSNGKSVEVSDTDSEGRLVLSDALVYAESMKPHTIIDIATLTGAMMVALGKAYIGTYTRSDDLWDELNIAGAQRHERFWRMPLDPIYRKPFDSEIADLKNSGSRAGGANGAAMSLGEFVSKSFKRWAHLYIAGVMKADGKGYYPNGMTAMPVRALIQFVQNLTN
ncbi:MAG: leucyl aminopeptidase, partial [Candidatus Heimdallarchaeota archaeon]|nr:leucyl aminopeptidase [Candidatus Heimdallarchaeota archaeon]